MEHTQPGLVTPPLVPPTVTTPTPTSEDWRVVGSPPQRPRLSPPENSQLQQEGTLEKPCETNGSASVMTADLLSNLQDKQSKNPHTSTVATKDMDRVQDPHEDKKDTHDKQIKQGKEPESTVIPPKAIIHASEACTVQEKGKEKENEKRDTSACNKSTHDDLERAHLQSKDHAQVIFQDSSTCSVAGTTLAYIAATTGTLSSTGTMAPSQLSLGANVFIPQSKPSTLSLNTGSGTLASNNRSGLESPLSVTSFIWSGHVSDDPAATPPSSYSATAPSTTRETQKLGIESSASSLLMRQGDMPSSFSGSYSNRRSLSFSEPGGYSTNMGLNSSSSGFSSHSENNAGSFRVPPSILEEDPDELIEPRLSRNRSHSTSATFGSGGMYSNLMKSTFEDQHSQHILDSQTLPRNNALGVLNGQDQRHSLHAPLHSNATWAVSWNHSLSPDAMGQTSRRRSVTGDNSHPIWEDQSPYSPLSPSGDAFYTERQRTMRRYSVAPSSGFQTYDRFVENSDNYNRQSTMFDFDRQLLENDYNYPLRRHSVAGPSGSYIQTNSSRFNLDSALDNLQLEDDEGGHWATEEQYDMMGYQGQDLDIANVGKSMTLSQIARHGSLYVVEFKSGRSDLFYATKSSGLSLRCGDLVMVEADRGKDLGKVTNDSITVQQVQALQIENAEAAAVTASLNQQDGARMPKEVHPKRIFRLATTSEIADLATKNQDEMKAMVVCQAKVRQKNLPMEVVNAEYQWDRRKLTFFFISDRRIDFRELVRELFKIYKTRIWMYAVNQGPTNGVSENVIDGEVTTEALSMPAPAASGTIAVSAANTSALASSQFVQQLQRYNQQNQPHQQQPHQYQHHHHHHHHHHQKQQHQYQYQAGTMQPLQPYLEQAKRRMNHHLPQQHPTRQNSGQFRSDFRGMSTPFAGIQQEQGYYDQGAFVGGVGSDS
ncbi:hypothetical protein BG004_004266 [Podila humilis]|nr:hypothetical protein BG004_004266 [Podila humilis]